MSGKDISSRKHIGQRSTTVGGESERPLVVVAIGASAGGLEAIEAFLAEAGCLPYAAFVVVQHLGAGTPSMLPELLQKTTRLPVKTIQKGAPVAAQTVYVAPPGLDVEFAKGKFVLKARRPSHAAGLPIDVCFRSLASTYQTNAVGVVMSGMGSDGSLGLQALKDQGGATFVQSPETARFDSMPRSALETGAVDAAAPAAELPARIAEHLARGARHLPSSTFEVDDRQALDTIIEILRAHTGHDFATYKKSTLLRRIERRMALHHRRSMSEYSRTLKANNAETELLFKELLIGVTSFFRDPRVWEHLRESVLPEFLAGRAAGRRLRVWIPGCSTGEEAYTLAMVLAEAMSSGSSKALDFRIFATDIDGDAIDRARLARYPLSIADTVSAQRLSRFFVREETGYQIRKELRETVIFAIQNVAMDPPFTKLDMLVCRNLLIYFEPTLQRRLLPLFHYSLERDGLLLLGAAETTGFFADQFEPLPGKFKLFRRLETFRNSGFVAFPAAFDRHATPSASDLLPGEPARDSEMSLQHAADHLLLQRYSPAAVLANRHGDVLYVSGKTGGYLEPAAGKANWNIFAMAREGLSRPLGAAFRQAVLDQRRVDAEGALSNPDFGTRRIRVTVDPIASPTPLAGMVMIVFNDTLEAPRAAATMARHAESIPGSDNLEIVQLLESLRAAREEAQSAHEQSRASNEELQSTNEELQSTNEELTTSKEELQSMNEELQTVNQELQSKVDELSQASDDMRNLLNSTEIATLFLDEQLRIRRYTSQATTVFKLIASDVGRPITDINNALQDWRVADDAEAVLQSLVPKEKEVEASGERCFKVRMMPYRTSDNRIDGVVITMSDISASKRLENRLVEALEASRHRPADTPADTPAPKPPKPRRPKAVAASGKKASRA